jgi:predicted metal-binding membrane protein
MWARADTRRPLAWLLAALSGLAWLALWLADRTPYGRYLSHHALEGVRGEAALAPLFVGGWLVMVVAMMLPTSLPLVTLFQAMTRGRRGQARLIALLLGGYLAAWTLFGAVVYAADWGLHRAMAQSHWLADRAWLLSALTVLGAGAFQFTPLKYHCLDKCRSPLAFISERWHGHRPTWEALRLGLAHGLFCVGCCWALMLLMFAVGAGSLGWMLVLGVVMAVEKNLPWGRRIGKPVGVALLALGVVLLVAGGPAHVHAPFPPH